MSETRFLYKNSYQEKYTSSNIDPSAPPGFGDPTVWVNHVTGIMWVWGASAKEWARYSSATILQNILFVDPNGDDTTAVKGSIHSPWKTFEGAYSNMVSGDLLKAFKGNFSITSALNLISEDRVLDFSNCYLETVFNGVAIAISGAGVKLKILAGSIQLNENNVTSYLIDEAVASDSEIIIESDFITGVADDVSTWGRTQLIQSRGDLLDVKIKEVRWWGQGLINTYASNNKIDIGTAIIVDNGGVDAGRFDEVIVTFRTPANGGIANNRIDIGNFINERTDSQKNGPATISGDSQNTVMIINNYTSAANRSSVKATALDVQVDYYEYAFGLPSGVADNMKLDYYIKNLTGEHLFYDNRKGTDRHLLYTVDKAVVDCPLYLMNLATAHSSGGDVMTNSSNRLNFGIVQVDAMPVVLIKSMAADNTNFIIEGGKWQVDGNYGIYIHQYEFENNSDLIIDVDKLESTSQGIYLKDCVVNAGCSIIIKGSYKVSNVATPVITIENGTWNGNLILDNCTLVNDGATAAITSNIAVDVVIKNTYANAVAIDANVTEIVSSIIRDVNVI